jgi:Tol biopolymer transport system component
MTRDEIEALERALRETPLPEEVAARERARQTVAAAHAQATPRRRARTRLVWVAALALAMTVGVSQRDSGIAREVGGWVRAVVKQPTPTPTSVSGFELPADGKLLVSEASGLYVVERNGKRRRLGSWQDATWSPRGLFVAAASGNSLVAIDPKDRTVRWQLRRPEKVSHPRWAPDGFHVAYRSGGSLRIVYGNGEHDVKAGDRMANVAPAWRPSEDRTLAWAATDGTVTIEDALTAKVLRTFDAARVRSLVWSADGRRLLIAGRRGYTVHDLATGERDASRLPYGSTLLAAAYAPTGTRLALALYNGGQTEVRIQDETVLRATGRLADLEWSPDGRWLLAGWPSADHWLLVRASAHARDAAVSGIRHRFGATARTHGWCC